jgi:ribosomal protein S8
VNLSFGYSSFILLGLKKYSLFSRRSYLSIRELRKLVAKGNMFSVVSTPLGVIFVSEAVKKNVSGELLLVHKRV